MIAEYGAAFKDEKGGMYSWMANSYNPKFAFVGTFMWYASYIIWMVNVGSGIWIPLSNAIFGVDKTQSWHLFGMLNGVQTLGILAIVWIIFLTYVSSHGLDRIKKITSVGGTAVALINILLFLGGFIILILNGHMAQPLSLRAFFVSPNPDYHSMTSIFSFTVFAIFAYGGLEVVGGLVDQTENAEKTVPRALTISAIVISVGYALGIFMVGTFTNWKFTFEEFGTVKVTMGNVSYVMMNNMGYQLGLAMHLSRAAAVTLGEWISRYMGISMFLSLTGGFFTLIYSPLKQLIEGTPKQIWPKSWTKMRNGMPVNAMWSQAIIVIVIIAIVSFGGSDAQAFFNILISMTNVSMTIPYMFVAFAFLGFKRNKNIVKPFEMFHKKWTTEVCVWLVLFSVGFANFFTILQPALTGDYLQAIETAAGPILFGGVAWWMYSHYENKYVKNQN
ncbi:inner membrane transporter YjeM [Lactobacillus selangorensis]|uniref:Inner membrane transporter YjeM n=2 Tax=Lactobacillus selangorensis TaxID=81857 RepID=A0A0R2FIS6_9LACO|nr:inner membrane transporter YjeM [Lactobacillus selangorensis]KRN32015.1 inner membrane transporter YjeM [Lactobacillus selangorensis]